MEPYREAAEQSEPEPERGPGLDAASAAPWWALRRRWRWWVRLGSPWARRRREAVRAERERVSRICAWAHRTGIPRERVETYRDMGLMPDQLLEKLQPFVTLLGTLKPRRSWPEPPYVGRAPRRVWRVTRKGRWVRE